MEDHIRYLGQSEECTNAKNGVMSIEFKNFPDTKPFLISLKLNSSGQTLLNVGVCMPAACSPEDVMNIFEGFYYGIFQKHDFSFSAKEESEIKTSSPEFIVSWVFYSILFLFMAVGTFVGVTKEMLSKFLNFFSRKECLPFCTNIYFRVDD